MKFKQFKSQIIDKMQGGYSRVKILNRARKHGLKDYLNEMYDVMGHYFSIEELAEFVVPEDRTKKCIINGRLVLRKAAK